MSDNSLQIESELLDIIRTKGKVTAPAARIGNEDDLYKLGLSSLATVNVMLEIEGRFNIEIPDEALTRDTFRTIASLAALVRAQQSKSVTA